MATAKTYVARLSVVAWHAPGYQPPLCEHEDLAAASSYTAKAWTSLPAPIRQEYCDEWASQAAFFKKRGAAPAILFSTKSAYVSRQLTRLADERGLDTNKLLWMWHPRNHEGYFTTKVTYESYPQSQDEVDYIARTFRLSKIIYDP